MSEKPPINAQPEDVFRSTTLAVGSCLTCDLANKYVYVIRHNGSEVRLCATCITIIGMKIKPQ